MPREKVYGQGFSPGLFETLGTEPLLAAPSVMPITIAGRLRSSFSATGSGLAASVRTRRSSANVSVWMELGE